MKVKVKVSYHISIPMSTRDKDFLPVLENLLRNEDKKSVEIELKNSENTDD